MVIPLRLLLLALLTNAHELVHPRGPVIIREKPLMPFDVLFIMPVRASPFTPLGLTLDMAMPVLDLARTDAVAKGIMPEGWINITYADEKTYDALTEGEVATSIAMIDAYVENRLDVMMGFDDVYGLATVSRLSAELNKGIPVITTIGGWVAAFSQQENYPLLTRFGGAEMDLVRAVFSAFGYNSTKMAMKHDPDDPSMEASYKNLAFFIHDERSGYNRQQNQKRAPITHSSHCHFLYTSIKMYFTKSDPAYDDFVRGTKNLIFDEKLPRAPDELHGWLRNISMMSNGTSLHFLSFHSAFQSFTLCSFRASLYVLPAGRPLSLGLIELSPTRASFHSHMRYRACCM